MLKSENLFVLISLLNLFSCRESPPVTTGELLPSSRRIHWDPGVPGGIPDIATGANVADFDAKGDGIHDDYSAFHEAILSVGKNGAVEIPPGTYLIKSPIKIENGVLLRGSGIGTTNLKFDFDDSPAEAAIRFAEYDRGSFVAITEGFSKGSKRLNIGDASGFQDGGFAEIQQDNDPVRMYTDPRWDVPWAKDAVGQVLRIRSVGDTTLELEDPLNFGYSAHLNPRIRPIQMITHAGIERLSLARLDAGDGDMIEFVNAAYCWVREIESRFASRRHVGLTSSYRCTVRDNYFHHAHEYGGGGHGYGVACSRHTSGCLVENNVFSDLRHAMLLQLGANGNVFGYNYSANPVAQQENWQPPDVSLHGHYLYMNLFEGNIVQEIATDYWGPTGPGNTFFRNRIEGKGISIRDQSHGQNIIGNVLAGSEEIEIHSSVENTLIRMNSAGKLSQHSWTLPQSYYLSGRPEFFGDLSWPVFNEDSSKSQSIPARQRYFQKNQ